jgi:hypothetical protein
MADVLPHMFMHHCLTLLRSRNMADVLVRRLFSLRRYDPSSAPGLSHSEHCIFLFLLRGSKWFLPRPRRIAKELSRDGGVIQRVTTGTTDWLPDLLRFLGTSATSPSRQASDIGDRRPRNNKIHPIRRSWRFSSIRPDHRHNLPGHGERPGTVSRGRDGWVPVKADKCARVDRHPQHMAVAQDGRGCIRWIGWDFNSRTSLITGYAVLHRIRSRRTPTKHTDFSTLRNTPESATRQTEIISSLQPTGHLR